MAYGSHGLRSASHAAAAVGGLGTFAAGQVGGSGVGALASIGTEAATGAVGIAIAGAVAGPAGALAAALATLATIAKTAANGLKELAGAASPNGLKGLEQAARLFAATIGVTVLPFVTLFAAGVMTAADLLARDLNPHLAATAAWYESTTPMFVTFAKALVLATEALVTVGKVLAFQVMNLTPPGQGYQIGKGLFGTGEAVAGAGYKVGRFLSGQSGEDERGRKLDEQIAAGNKARGMAAPGEEDSAAKMFADNLSAIVKDMTAAMGPRGGVGDLQGAWKKAQDAAFGGAIEQKFLQRFDRAITLLSRLANQRPDQPVKK
jgi:hypothetical protein